MATAPRRRKKTTADSAATTPEKIPQAHGGAINSGGTPGNKGGGRPPKPFKDFLAELRKNPDAQDALQRAAMDEKSPGFRAAWDLAAKYDDEKPAERHHHELPAEQRQERVISILRTAKARKPA